MKQIFKDKKGQTLIEIIIAIAVGTLIITAILALATRSNRNSNLARASAQASKLAEGGLEVIKNIKSEGQADVMRPDGGVPLDTKTWLEFYSDDVDENEVFHLWEPSEGSCPPGMSWCLYAEPTLIETINLDEQIFSRRVEISDESNVCNENISFDQIKQFSVIVIWTDPVGEHEQRVVTCIRR